MCRATLLGFKFAAVDRRFRRSDNCGRSVRSEGQLIEQLEFGLLFCPFVRLPMDDPLWRRPRCERTRLGGSTATSRPTALLGRLPPTGPNLLKGLPAEDQQSDQIGVEIPASAHLPRLELCESQRERTIFGLRESAAITCSAVAS